MGKKRFQMNKQGASRIVVIVLVVAMMISVVAPIIQLVLH